MITIAPFPDDFWFRRLLISVAFLEFGRADQRDVLFHFHHHHHHHHHI
jgi:hypothetical protein